MAWIDRLRDNVSITADVSPRLDTANYRFYVVAYEGMERRLKIPKLMPIEEADFHLLSTLVDMMRVNLLERESE